MTASDHPDPWASLAESLGVGPGGEPSRQPAPPPRPAAPRAPAPPKPKTSAPPPASWDALATDLGIQPLTGEPPARAAAEPPQRAVEPRREFEQRPRRDDLAETADHAERRRAPPDRGQREGRGTSRGRDDDRDTRIDDREPRADERDASTADDAGPPRDGDQADRGERRGRRRRSRRGGRGRREREPASGSAVGPARDEASAPGFDREDRPRTTEGADDDSWSRDDDLSSRRDVGEAADGPRPDAAADGRDEDRPRRRGRRGRRGGRGRSRAQRERSDAPAPARTDDLGDEPLPTSYGMRPAAGRTTESGDQTRDQSRDQSDGRRGTGDRAGSGSSRGRRRRRGGEGRGSAGAAADTGRGRRSRRGDEGRSRTSRVARVDFAPVSDTYDEDDEGLEFLGLEDADRPPRRREARTADDDVLAESGLDSVREVPSWVEAIGIVIAGNLDARTRGRGDGGRHRDR